MAVNCNRFTTKWKLPSWRTQGNTVAQLEYRLLSPGFKQMGSKRRK